MNFIKSFLKKYSALLLPTGLVIVAFLLMIPSILIGRSLSQEMEKSEQMHNNITRLLGQAPSQADVKAATDYYERYENEGNQIEQMAVATTTRDLIQYGLFPKPQDDSQQVYSDFGNNFRAYVEDLIRQMNAKDAPSQAEIQNQLGYSIAQPVGGGEMFGMTGGRNPMGARGQVSQNEVLDAICKQRAAEIPVYADPEIFLNYRFWEDYNFPGSNQAIKDCWYTQIAYWIYEDVAHTITSMNTGSGRVETSPVKRLLGVRFQGPVVAQGTSRTGMTGGGFVRGGAVQTAMDKPIYLIGSTVTGAMSSVGGQATGAASSSPFMPQSWTGRLGDEEIDVIHFAVSVIVDSQYVQAFYKELCSGKPHQYREGFKQDGALQEGQHNQITILESTVSAVDLTAAEHSYYRYGTTGAMQVDLICEYLFNRGGYDSIKPDQVKEELGQGNAATNTTAPNRSGMPYM